MPLQTHVFYSLSICLYPVFFFFFTRLISLFLGIGWRQKLEEHLRQHIVFLKDSCFFVFFFRNYIQISVVKCLEINKDNAKRNKKKRIYNFLHPRRNVDIKLRNCPQNNPLNSGRIILCLWLFEEITFSFMSSQFSFQPKK